MKRLTCESNLCLFDADCDWPIKSYQVSLSNIKLIFKFSKSFPKNNLSQKQIFLSFLETISLKRTLKIDLRKSTKVLFSQQLRYQQQQHMVTASKTTLQRSYYFSILINLNLIFQYKSKDLILRTQETIPVVINTKFKQPAN